MIKVALVRGKYLNNFEGQNYIFKKTIELIGISSFSPIHQNLPFEMIKLPSLADLPFQVGVSYLANRILGDSQILFGLERLMYDFDIFHTADSHYYYSYQLARLRKRKLIKCLISTSWETIPFNNETVGRKKTIKEFTRKNIDLFICHTERAKKCLIREGVNPVKIKVVRLGVDLRHFKYQRLKIKNQNNNTKIKILFAGRNVKEKGMEDLQRATQGMKNVELKVATNILYGKMPLVYQNADILVMPSKRTKTWEEQYGMVLVEAMASGLAIVAYDSGAIPEVLGNAGILVKEGDIKNLARSLRELSMNKDLGLKLAKIGKERAEKEFDSRKTAQNLKKIYETQCDNFDKERREKY